MSEKQFMQFPVSQLKVDMDAPGTFEAVVSVFGNVDRGGDRVVEGAFAQTLKQKGLPPVLWAHDMNTPPIGKLIEARETPEGLYVKGQLFVGEGDDHPVAKQVHTGMKAIDGHGEHVLREFSFAYDAKDTNFVEEDGVEIRELLAVELYEVSPVVVGMNDRTRLIGVKAAELGQLTADEIKAIQDLRKVAAKGDQFTDDEKTVLPLQMLLIAPDDMPFDAAGARGRIAKWASNDGTGNPDTIDFRKFRRGFLFVDDMNPNSPDGYRFPIADVVGPDLQIVPAALSRAGSQLEGSGIDPSDISLIQSHIAGHQERVANRGGENSAGSVAGGVPKITAEHAARVAELRNIGHQGDGLT